MSNEKQIESNLLTSIAVEATAETTRNIISNSAIANHVITHLLSKKEVEEEDFVSAIDRLKQLQQTTRESIQSKLDLLNTLKREDSNGSSRSSSRPVDN